MAQKEDRGVLQLDAKNRRILLELDRNSRASLAELAGKTRLSKEVVFHRINNLVKEGIILRFQAVVSSYRLGYQSYKIYFRLQDMNPKAREKLQGFLMKDSMVYWVGVCQGRWDMIIAYWARSAREVGEFEDRLLHKFSQHIQEKTVTISRQTAQYNRRWFAPEGAEPVEMDFGEGSEVVEIDEIDTKILQQLANNARMKLTELAEATNLTPSIMRYRIRNLEGRGIIVGYKYALDTRRLGYETCKAFLSLKESTPAKRKALMEYCKMKPNTINIVSTIGPWDMEIEFEVRNFEEYYSIMSDIQERFGRIIKSYDSVLFSSEPKQSFMPGAK